MAAMIDTSRYVKIPYHRGKLAGLVLISILAVAVCVWSALGIGPRHSGFSQIMGCAGVALFSWMSAVFTSRMLRLGTYLTLSPRGFRLGKTSADLIAWTGVTAVREQRIKLSKYLLLSLTPEASAHVAISSLGRLLGQRKPPSSLHINSQTAAVSHDELVRLVQAFFQAHGSPSGAATNHTDPSIRLAR